MLIYFQQQFNSCTSIFQHFSTKISGKNVGIQRKVRVSVFFRLANEEKSKIVREVFANRIMPFFDTRKGCRKSLSCPFRPPQYDVAETANFPLIKLNLIENRDNDTERTIMIIIASWVEGKRGQGKGRPPQQFSTAIKDFPIIWGKLIHAKAKKAQVYS